MDATEERIARLQSIMDMTADEHGVPHKTLQVTKRRQAGVCRKKYIRIAKWVLEQPEAMQIYLVLHEIAHDIARWENKHNGYFKEVEEKVLNSWGIFEIRRPRKYIEAVKMDGKWYTWNHMKINEAG